jgi:AcrR family transcriptional regulator
MKRSSEPVAAKKSVAKPGRAKQSLVKKRSAAERATTSRRVAKIGAAESATPESRARRGPGKKNMSASILAAAREMLDREGIAAVAMRSVAERVGVTPMAIYRHFADREALLNAVADAGFEELTKRARATKREGGLENQVMTLGKVFVNAALESPHLYELMFLAPRKGARVYPDDFHAGRSPTFQPLVEMLEEAMREGELRDDDAVEIAFELSAISHGLIVLYLGGRLAQSEEEFRSLYQRSFWRYFDGLRH